MHILLLTTLILIFYLPQFLAKNHFVIKHFATPSIKNIVFDRTIQFIRYSIKIPSGFPSKNGPIFYFICGQDSIEAAQNKYRFLEKVSPQFNDATIMFVETRFFGNSSLLKEPHITWKKDLSGLKFPYIIDDNIVLIKKLAKQLKTYNFLVFGVNYGGMLAAHLSRHFSTKPNLKIFKIMSWTSSIPIKYTQKDEYGISVHSIDKQFARLLLSDCGNDGEFLAHFGAFFGKLRDLQQPNKDTYNSVLAALNIEPIPDARSDNRGVIRILMEFVIFIRNGIRKLAFNNRKFDENGNKIKETVLRKLCNAMSKVPLNKYIPLSPTHIENILLLLLPNYGPRSSGKPPSFWRLNPAAGANWQLNREASLNMFLDCTQLQLIECPNNKDPKDPFANSTWNTRIDCLETTNSEKLYQDECNGLLELPSTYYDSNVIQQYYKNALKQNAIVTFNRKSIYYDSYKTFWDTDNNATSFSYHYDLPNLDGSEFETPKTCDMRKVNQIRYTVLKGFACFANLIEKSDGICDGNIFDIGDDDENDEINAKTCRINNSSNFPFGYTPLEFVKTKTMVDSKSNRKMEDVKNEDKITNGGVKLFCSKMGLFLTSLLMLCVFVVEFCDFFE